MHNNQIDSDLINSPHRIPVYSGEILPIHEGNDFYINHYMLKSEQDVRQKCMKGHVWNIETAKKIMSNIDRSARLILQKYNTADTEDCFILKYADQIKAKIVN